MKVVRQPVVFVPHGAGPCFFMEWRPAETWDAMAEYLRGIIPSLPQRPEAIVVVSAHWLSHEFAVTSAAQPELIYDYYGFPESTYALQYPAPGAPKLAQQIVELLGSNGLHSSLDPQRGFDHGVFIPLKVMHPDADIPVVTVSLQQDLDPALHIKAGAALAPLREQNVLIVASGMSFHNMRGYGDRAFTEPSYVFDEWLIESLALPQPQRIERLQHWEKAPHGVTCHPPGHEEHLLPLMVAVGAAGDDIGVVEFSDEVLQVRLSGFRFTAAS